NRNSRDPYACLLVREFRDGHPPQPALLIPSDTHQIKNAAPEPVPYAIFGEPGHARAMINRHFLDRRTGAQNQDGQKAMPAVEREDTVQRGAFECAQAAAGVTKVRAQNGPARPARDSRGYPTEPIVLAIDPEAADEIEPVQFGEQSGQVCRIILQIAVERGDDAA